MFWNRPSPWPFPLDRLPQLLLLLCIGPGTFTAIHSYPPTATFDSIKHQRHFIPLHLISLSLHTSQLHLDKRCASVLAERLVDRLLSAQCPLPSHAGQQQSPVLRPSLPPLSLSLLSRPVETLSHQKTTVGHPPPLSRASPLFRGANPTSLHRTHISSPKPATARILCKPWNPAQVLDWHRAAHRLSTSPFVQLLHSILRCTPSKPPILAALSLGFHPHHFETQRLAPLDPHLGTSARSPSKSLRSTQPIPPPERLHCRPVQPSSHHPPERRPHSRSQGPARTRRRACPHAQQQRRRRRRRRSRQRSLPMLLLVFGPLGSTPPPQR